MVPLHNVDIATFSVVVSHVYSNLHELTPEVVYDVLEASDMFLLSGMPSVAIELKIETIGLLNPPFGILRHTYS